jgi:hypothetical protein
MRSIAAVALLTSGCAAVAAGVNNTVFSAYDLAKVAGHHRPSVGMAVAELFATSITMAAMLDSSSSSSGAKGFIGLWSGGLLIHGLYEISDQVGSFPSKKEATAANDRPRLQSIETAATQTQATHDDDGPSPDPSPDPHAVISIDELLSRFDDNAKAADAAFHRDPKLRVQGPIEVVDLGKGPPGIPYVTITGSNPLRAVQCFFADAVAIVSLHAGMQVTLSGAYHGADVNVILTGCAVELSP